MPRRIGQPWCLFTAAHMSRLPLLADPTSSIVDLGWEISRGEDGWRGAADFRLKASAWPWHRHRHGIHLGGRLRADVELLLCLPCFYASLSLRRCAPHGRNDRWDGSPESRRLVGRSVGRIIPTLLCPVIHSLSLHETRRRDETRHCVLLWAQQGAGAAAAAAGAAVSCRRPDTRVSGVQTIRGGPMLAFICDGTGSVSSAIRGRSLCLSICLPFLLVLTMAQATAIG